MLVTLNRPEVLNAINTQMGIDQLDLWTKPHRGTGASCAASWSPARASRAFCAGGDLKQRDGMTQAEWQAQHEIFEKRVHGSWWSARCR